MPNIITIDGVDYNVDDMSDKAKTQIYNIRATDQEIARLKALTAMLETARITYAKTLKSELDIIKPEGSAN